MKNLSIDLETYSSADIRKTGVYKYAEAEDFEILLFGYSVDGGEVVVIDLTAGERIPPEILAALDDDSIIKWAFNATFERVCLSRYVAHVLKPGSWHCSMVWAGTLGLPMTLAGVGAVLGLEKQKMTEGKALIQYFCKPCKATKSNGGRTRNLPADDPEKWAVFKAYNKRDVETELAIKEKLARFPVPDSEWENYRVDQIINDRGVAIDQMLAQQAIRCDEQGKEANLAEAKAITGLDNPNSPLQILGWLKEHGLEADSLAKDKVAELLEKTTGDVHRVLELRQLLSKSSVKKYTAMETCRCRDGRAHGLFQFYGATHTGRYAGRLIQVQNLRRNNLPDLAEARSLVREGQFEMVDCLYESTPDVLSQLIRTAFVPEEGYRFIVADYSAIEARVIAWLAGEQWRQKAFKEGADIYCASASQMFGVPVMKHGINGHLRQKGKIAELACGYGGGVGALKAMGALEMGLPEAELPGLIAQWRESNPHIVQLWWDVDKAVKQAVKDHLPHQTHGLVASWESGILFLRLPSGRRLAYVKPRIEENQFGGESVTYEGTGTARKWMRLESYGPKFCENITQAIARDLLAGAMKRLTDQGFRIVMHVHDEVIVEVPEGQSSVEEICGVMCEKPEWGGGLVLNADGDECKFYMKD